MQGRDDGHRPMHHESEAAFAGAPAGDRVPAVSEASALRLSPADLAACLRRVPDTPAWIDVRGLLLSGRCRLIGERDPARGFVVRSTEFAFAGVVGEPDREVIQRAAIAEEGKAGFHLLVPAGEGSAVARRVESALPRWRRQTVVMHRWGGDRRPVATVERTVTLVEGGPQALALKRVAGEVRREVALALATRRPMTVVWVGERPVSFCYAAWQTETLWDVAVSTVETHRRRGHAAAAFEELLRRLEPRGLEPVWNAFAGNSASLALAARLGFVAAARTPALAPPAKGVVGP